MRDRFEGLIFGIFRYSILVQVSNSRVSVFSPLNWADSAHAFLPLKIVVVIISEEGWSASQDPARATVTGISASRARPPCHISHMRREDH